MFEVGIRVEEEAHVVVERDQVRPPPLRDAAEGLPVQGRDVGVPADPVVLGVAVEREEIPLLVEADESEGVPGSLRDRVEELPLPRIAVVMAIARPIALPEEVAVRQPPRHREPRDPAPSPGFADQSPRLPAL